ncbi:MULTISPECIES: hypothetical protein, partial [unclassified Microcystis]|uniref:hypothetical protein n=1 Tax=unclassified Microcystis TaxID=2643300 RepID=UPI002582E518
CLAFKLLFCLGSSVVCFASLSLRFNRAFTNVSNFPKFVNPFWQNFLIFFLSLATSAFQTLVFFASPLIRTGGADALVYSY